MFVFPQVYIHRSVGASLPPVDGATHSEGPVVHGREATHARPPRLLAVLPLRSALSTRHIRGKYKLQNNCKITESICMIQCYNRFGLRMMNLLVLSQGSSPNVSSAMAVDGLAPQ